MGGSRVSTNWLSDDMAHALAAMCPPLQPADVLRAADRLSRHGRSPQKVVVDGMFQPGLDPLTLRNVIEALRALYDLRWRQSP
jgi:hypothetical protein